MQYIRNRYKTKETYGTKTHKITDEKFTFAIKKIYQMIKKSDSEEYVNPIIPNPSTISYRVQSATYKSLGEGAYVKICINHFRNDTDALQRIIRTRTATASSTTTDQLKRRPCCHLRLCTQSYRSLASSVMRRTRSSRRRETGRPTARGAGGRQTLPTPWPIGTALARAPDRSRRRPGAVLLCRTVDFLKKARC